MFSIVNKVSGLRLSSFINVAVNGEICLNSEFTDISVLLLEVRQKKASPLLPHLTFRKKKKKTLQLCMNEKTHFSIQRQHNFSFRPTAA